MPREHDENPSKDPEYPVGRPFKPDIEGELKRRLFRYAKEKGRSASNALKWALSQFLKAEGF